MSQSEPTQANADSERPTKVPEPEVVPRAKRRQFPGAYKLQIVEEADRSTEHGQIVVGSESETKEVELQKWARPLFADLLIVNGDHKCPQGTSSARHVATLAGLKACREDCATTSQDHRTDSDHIPVAST